MVQVVPSNFKVLRNMQKLVDHGNLNRDPSMVLCTTIPNLKPIFETLKTWSGKVAPRPGGEPTKVKCNYIRANVITFAQM